MCMITLDDVMDVLVKGNYLDPRFANDKGEQDYIRSELEQKSYICGSTNEEIQSLNHMLNSLTVESVCQSIQDGTLKDWIQSIRAQGKLTIEMLLRDQKDGK